MYVSTRRLALAATLLTLLAIVAYQPQPAGAQSSNPIVRTALAKVGSHGGQCKVFVQNVVREATGISIGSGYRQAYLRAGVEVNPANAQPGDILQIASRSNPERYQSGYHTAIVVENLGNGRYKVVDSNWGWDQRVRVHEWSPRPASHLRLYAYRIGGGGGGSSSGTVSSSGSATVAAGSSCLYLRTGPGLNKTALDCLPTGTPVTVLSGTVAADGYNWVKVRTSSGQEGWVASRYLKR